MIRVSATWNDQGLNYLKWSGSQLPEMIRVWFSATWSNQGLNYLKWSGSQLPEMIRVSATWSNQGLNYLKWSGSQLSWMIKISATWNVWCLSYLKWSGSQLPGKIRVAIWSDHCDQSLCCFEWLVFLLGRREKEKTERWRMKRYIGQWYVFQLRRVVSIVLQYKLSKVL